MTTRSEHSPKPVPPPQLEDMLEPGEQVIYRAPRRWEPDDWKLEWSIFGISIGLVATLGLIGLDLASLAAVAAAQVAPMSFVLGCYVRDWSREAMVTDRRLLHRTGWRSPKVTEVLTGDVKAVEAFKDRLRITRQAGTRLDLGHPHECWELGSALAHSADLAPPRVATRVEWLADQLWLVTGNTVGIVAAVIPLKTLYPQLFEAAGSNGWVGPVMQFVGIGWCAHTLGMILGGYLTLILLRPFISYTEMRDWIGHSLVFWPPASTPDLPDETAVRRLVALLYGRPFDDPNEGAKSSG